ncbi:MAG: hypothetical protein JWM47_3502 [Acidimicrobiales bacterium]|nr:hypothetical protein [Acidimicrobiales bacterium]
MTLRRTAHPARLGERAPLGPAAGERSWTRWNDRYWPRRAGWSPPMTALISRTTTAPERWPYPRTARAEPGAHLPPGW